MKRLEKLKKIGAILSLLVVAPTACAVGPFPADFDYVVDVTNQVCAKYLITDKVNYKVRLYEELPLLPKGPCDRLVGYHRNDAKDVQNWARDAIKELLKPKK